ncbi:hypothetical protein [Photobacterium iliopiscarium]|uniref:hypothetical protein n=1 Tax=Photobacterium iliopiscarium TaxID=56192 RepID=UPI000A413E46|nr:hypothetical protein [Photobacterium iliopiscarium]
MPLSSYKPLLPLVIMGSALIISVNVNAQGLQCNNPASAIEKNDLRFLGINQNE